MSLRFFRRVKIAPGLTVNFSKSGGSLSFGPRGAKVTVGGSRGARGTIGLPGSGLFYTTSLSSKKKRGYSTTPTISTKDKLTLGFFKRLFTPQDEEGLVDGCREMFLGNDNVALEYLNRVSHLSDAAYLIGFLAFKDNRYDDAIKSLSYVASNPSSLSDYFDKYKISPTMSIPITHEITVHTDANLRGVLLALVELYQVTERWDDAIRALNRLLALDSSDIIVQISLAELLLDKDSTNKNYCKQIVSVTANLKNESNVHTALLLYKSRALKFLGLKTAARDTLTMALRRKKDRDAELLRAIRYERALLYGELGNKSRSRSELEKVYLEDPKFMDVGELLGV